MDASLQAAGGLTSASEGVSYQLRPAPLGKRLMALAVDIGVITSASYFAFLFFMVLMAGAVGMGAALRKMFQGLESAVGLGALIVLVLLIMVGLLAIMALFDGYFIYFEYRKGATPGKKLFGLRVVSLRNARLTLGQCCLREVLRHIDMLLILPGLISVVTTKRRQRLGDLAAGTLVTYSEAGEKSQDYLYTNRESFEWFQQAAQPLPVPDDIRASYLAFAYPAFVLQRETPDEPSLEKWAAVARQYLGKPEPLERDELLLFFSEHCFQQTNHRR